MNFFVRFCENLAKLYGLVMTLVKQFIFCSTVYSSKIFACMLHLPIHCHRQQREPTAEALKEKKKIKHISDISKLTPRMDKGSGLRHAKMKNITFVQSFVFRKTSSFLCESTL